MTDSPVIKGDGRFEEMEKGGGGWGDDFEMQGEG